MPIADANRHGLPLRLTENIFSTDDKGAPSGLPLSLSWSTLVISERSVVVAVVY